MATSRCGRSTGARSGSMRALRKTARKPDAVHLQTVDVPTPPAGHALIRVHTAGVCGTDVHLLRDRFPSTPPVTMGHEFSGVVEDLGPEVTSVSPGDRVVSANNPGACGTCRICKLGYPNLCEHKRAMGIHTDGCFADYVVLDARLLHKIPDGVGFAAAALTEPLAVATHTVQHRTAVQPGDSVLVLGPGAIGLLCAQVARAEGARWVAVAGTDRDESTRLPMARSLGFETVNVQHDDPVAWTKGRTDGYGADAVIEAAGSAGAIQVATEAVRRNGRIGAFGITGEPTIAVAWDTMVSRAVSVHFSYSSTHDDWRQSLDYLATGAVDTESLITHRKTLEQWREALVALESLEAIRPVLIIKQTKETQS